MLCVKAFLLLAGATGAWMLPDHKWMILCLFLACAVSFASHLIRNRHVSAALLFAYLLLPFPLSESVVFFPLVLFDIMYLRLYPLLIPAIPIFILRRPGGGVLPAMITESILAVCLAYCFRELSSLRKMLTQTRDEADDRALTLSAEKQALAEKQDAEVMAATLKERNRIAREIHDNVGHTLSRAILLTGALQTISRDDAIYEPLSRLNESLNEAMNAIRESVHDLYDDSLDLERASRALIDEFTFCPVTFRYQCESDMPREVKFCLLAVLKEALVNIAKHSHATCAEVSITDHPALYQMIIQNNDAASDGGQSTTTITTGNHRGIGLVGMSERVNALGGTIRFNGENGFRIFLTIPRKQIQAGSTPQRHTAINTAVNIQQERQDT